MYYFRSTKMRNGYIPHFFVSLSIQIDFFCRRCLPSTLTHLRKLEDIGSLFIFLLNSSMSCIIWSPVTCRRPAHHGVAWAGPATSLFVPVTCRSVPMDLPRIGDAKSVMGFLSWAAITELISHHPSLRYTDRLISIHYPASRSWENIECNNDSYVQPPLFSVTTLERASQQHASLVVAIMTNLIQVSLKHKPGHLN